MRHLSVPHRFINEFADRILLIYPKTGSIFHVAKMWVYIFNVQYHGLEGRMTF